VIVALVPTMAHQMPPGAVFQRGGEIKKLLLALLACLLGQSDLAAQTPFYQGQTVTIRVGFAAGGAFDVWARIIAQHLGKYVAGNPTFVVQNMTGGGSMIATNYIRAPRRNGPAVFRSSGHARRPPQDAARRIQ
jgi:tripartite-type tricarboxylate transporter receptor subunit TctC